MVTTLKRSVQLVFSYFNIHSKYTLTLVFLHDLLHECLHFQVKYLCLECASIRPSEIRGRPWNSERLENRVIFADLHLFSSLIKFFSDVLDFIMEDADALTGFR